MPVRDGRVFGVAEWGPPTAEQTVLWFHGTPGARRQVPEPARRYAIDHGIRVIGMDRPGVGLSTAAPLPPAGRLQRRPRGRARTSRRRAGSPWSRSRAARRMRWRRRTHSPNACQRVGILGGVVPSGGEDGIGGGLVGFAPLEVQTVLAAHERAGRRAPDRFCPRGRARSGRSRSTSTPASPRPATDSCWPTPEHKEMFLDDLSENGGHSMRAVVYDAILFTRYWGFSVRDVNGA